MKIIDKHGNESWVVTTLCRDDIIVESENFDPVVEIPIESLTDEVMEALADKISDNQNFMDAFWDEIAKYIRGI